jgi:hypothetical protein
VKGVVHCLFVIIFSPEERDSPKGTTDSFIPVRVTILSSSTLVGWVLLRSSDCHLAMVKGGTLDSRSAHCYGRPVSS